MLERSDSREHSRQAHGFVKIGCRWRKFTKCDLTATASVLWVSGKCGDTIKAPGIVDSIGVPILQKERK